MKRIDIIIPAYNSHKTIERTLASILMQTIVNDIRVLIVNDGGESYNNIIESFSKTSLEIIELDYKDNGGPSKARNFGLDNATSEYVMFIDSDDCFSSPWSVSELVNFMDKDPSLNIVTSSFEEERMDGSIKNHYKALTFTHGKIYRRSYLEKYKIRFNEQTRSCEDMGFNMLVLLLLIKDPGVSAHTDFVTYYWMNNSNSIGRANKEIYDNSICIQGYINNMIYLFEELKKRDVNEKALFTEKVTSTIKCVEGFIESLSRRPEFLKDNKKVLINFYNKIFKPIENSVSHQLLKEKYNSLPNKEEIEVDIQTIIDVIELLKTNPSKITLESVLKIYKRNNRR